MRDSDVAVKATLVCALVLSTPIITVGDGLPHGPPAVRGPSLRAADDAVVTSQTRHAVRGKPVVSTDVTEGKRKRDTDEERRAEAWVQQYNQNLSLMISEYIQKDWAYSTNLTEENKQKKAESSLQKAEWKQQKAEEANEYDWNNFQNSSLKRQFRFVTDIGTAAMKNKTKLKELKTLESDILDIYNTGKVCLDGKDFKLQDLKDIMATSRDYSRLLEAWEGWRREVGRPMKSLYQQFVDHSNEAIRDLGYNDTGEYWRSDYDSPTLLEDLKAFMEQLSPFYEQLHAYIRRRLREHYGQDKFPQTGHIPAHLLGNMWARWWNKIYDLVQPYPQHTAIDVTAAMQRQNYTVTQMFRLAEEFFTSLGFKNLLASFWKKSMLEKPADREVDCHPTSWDFYTNDDFRIKMCTVVDQAKLFTIHHEMGHIQYSMEYRHQPTVFKDGANPGFHEAVGDTISLSVNTLDHLRKIGLLEEGVDSTEDDINFLMLMALKKVASLPFAFLVDHWRWSVFAGDTTPEHYNHKWWQLRCRYEGLSPPVSRSTEDFDPGALFHIPFNYPFIGYFVAHVLQFQFQQALCKAAGHTKELHRCDIFGSQPAGELFRTMLSKGKSTPWPDVLEEMTGNRKMNASAILEYFRPLYNWLQKDNKDNQQSVGWSQECPPDN